MQTSHVTPSAPLQSNKATLIQPYTKMPSPLKSTAATAMWLIQVMAEKENR